jgi:hypothetical protein
MSRQFEGRQFKYPRLQTPSGCPRRSRITLSQSYSGAVWRFRRRGTAARGDSPAPYDVAAMLLSEYMSSIIAMTALWPSQSRKPTRLTQPDLLALRINKQFVGVESQRPMVIREFIKQRVQPFKTKLACGKATRCTLKPNTWQRRQRFRCSVVRGVVAYDESVDAKFAVIVEHGRKTQCFVPHRQNGEHVIACDWHPRTKQLKVRHTVPHGFHGGMTLPFADGGDPSVLLLAVLG